MEMGTKMPLAILETTDEQGIPQRVKLRPARVHDLGQIFMNLRRTQVVTILRGEFLDDKFF